MNLLIALIASLVLNCVFIVEKLVKFFRKKFNEAVDNEVSRIISKRKTPKKPTLANPARESSAGHPYRIPRTGTPA